MAKTETSNWTGKVVANGRFAVGELLGEGGMGQVYRARDHKNDRDVVIKVPHVVLLRDPEFVERFQREVESVRKLAHPHIVPVLCGGVHRDVPFVVLRYMPGGSLAEKIESTSLSERIEHLRTWLPQVADALDFVHDRGFIHRDIKPENIFLDKRDRACLGDFGIIKATSELTGSGGGSGLTMTGAVIGTPEYMAPEMAMGEDYDHRSDQYSLAVTVYETLNGAPPFQGPTPAAVLVQLTTTEFPDLSSLHPSIPARLSAAVSRGLSKEAVGRFHSCKEFSDAVVADDDSPSESDEWEEPTEERVATASFRTTASHRTRPRQSRRASRTRLLQLDPETPFAPLINSALALFHTTRCRYGLRWPVAVFVSLLLLTGAAFLMPSATNSDEPEPLQSLADRGAENPLDRLAPDASQVARNQELEAPTGEVDQASSMASGPGENQIPSDTALSAATVTAPLTLNGHTGPVFSVAFSPDGQRLASASGDGTVKVWDAATGQESLTLTGHTSPVFSVAFSSDGQRLASASYGQTVTVWDAATGRESLTLKGHTGWVMSVAFSRDGQRLASASWDTTVKVWDAAILTSSGLADQVASVPTGQPVSPTVSTATTDPTPDTSVTTTPPVESGNATITAVPVEIPEVLYSTRDSLLLGLGEDGWLSVPYRSVLGPGDRVAAPKPFSATLRVDAQRLAITLHGGSTLELMGATSEQALQFTLLRGRFTIERDDPKSQSKSVTVGLQLAGEPCQLTLPSGDSLCGIEIIPSEPIGFEIVPDQPYAGNLYVIKGRAEFAGVVSGKQNLLSPAWYRLSPKERAENAKSLNRSPLLTTPVWLDPNSRGLSAAQRRYAVKFANAIDPGHPIRESVPGVVLSTVPALSELAAKCLAVSELPSELVQALARTTIEESRAAAITGLRQWLPLAKQNAVTLKSELQKSFPPDEIDAIYRLLWGYGDDDARNEATSRILVDWLRHDSVVIRQLAFQHIFRLTNGQRYNYRPLNPENQRNVALQRWEMHLKKNGGALLP